MNRSGEQRLVDSVDLAQLLGSDSAPTKLLGVVANRAPEGRPLSADEIVDATDTLDRTLATAFIEFVQSRGYATLSPDGNSVEIDYDACIELLTKTRKARRLLDHVEETSETANAEFVCTLPTNDPSFGPVDPVDFGMQQITTRLLSLCRDATDEIVLTSPFLEVDGMGWLLPGLEGALERGVDLTLVSRQLRPGQPNHDAVQELFSIASGTPGTLEVYDYYKSRRDSSHPEYTLHSKLLVVDQSTAYIGSANFTKYGFAENLEVGVVVEATGVASLIDLVAHLITESGVRVRR